MRVTLVNPFYTMWKPEARYVEWALGRQPPLGLLSVAAYVRQHLPEVPVRIIDAAAASLSVEETADRAARQAPDAVGLTVATMAAPAAQAVAERIKARLPRTVVIVGGPYVSGAGPEALRQHPAFDLGVAGEGEETFKELLEAIRDGRPVERIPGVLCRSGEGQIRHGGTRRRMESLDALPLPAWDLLEDFPRAYPGNIFFSPRGPVGSLTTSRGCPFSCRFCDQSTFGRQYRALSAGRVFESIKHLQEAYGIRYLIFCDDTFTMDRQRVLGICEMLRQLPRLRWSCDANVMTVDEEMLATMKRSGCWSVSLGLESGSRPVLESLGKRIELGRAREVVRAARRHGLPAKGLFMLGSPEESAESVRQTRAFIRALPLSSLNLSKFTPYPGSELGAQVADQGAVGLERLNGMNFVVPSRYLSIAELEDEYRRTLRSFYWTFRSWRTHLPILLGQWAHVARLTRAAVGALRAGCC